jgi:transcription elongation GreA/GreB family factor
LQYPRAALSFSPMDKIFLVEQLGEKLRMAVQETHRAAEEARTDARSGAPRAVNIALGQGKRSAAAREALDAMDTFRVHPLQKGERIGMGTVVEVEDGESGRTLFIAPVGAGEELTGPGGDGLFQVVTPSSPFGRALVGKRVGEVAEVAIHGELVEWTIVFAA